MQNLRNVLIALLVGIVLGASVGIGLYARNTTDIVAERDGLKLAVEDWERKYGELDRQLREARQLDDERRKLDEEIARTLREGARAVSAARTDYERGLAQLKFAKDIFEILRKKFDLSCE